MRKRTLYVSELLKRFEFKSWHVGIFTAERCEYHETIEKALKSIYVDSQVKRYYISDITFIIYI